MPQGLWYNLAKLNFYKKGSEKIVIKSAEVLAISFHGWGPALNC